MFRFNLKKNKGPTRTCFKGGFTLLEALVAVSILMVAVMAPMTIAQKGLSSATYTKNQMIASYLAQDAIEYIKNKRDEISIGNNFDWDNLNYFSNCLTDNWCGLDTITEEIKDEEDTLLSKDNNNFFGYTGTTETNFSRKINIKLNSNEALIDVIVKWGNNTEDQVEVKTLIFNY
jgi:Tfp pilus assembly protein PilV